MENFINIRHNNLRVKLAESREEIESARRLRFSELVRLHNKDISYENSFDDSDFIYDHLIVKDIDTDEIVGAYRLGTREQLKRIGNFYTEVKFDISALKKVDGEILELSRMVVKDSYRDGSVVKLLWKGLFEYCERFKVRYLFGVVSLPTTNPKDAENFLSYISHNLISKDFDLSAKEPIVKTDLLPPEKVDVFKAKKEMHPILKAYIAMGCKFARNAHLDLTFYKSIDVMIVIDFQKVNPKYIQLVTRL